jgi:hypothetical protein
MSAIQDYVSTSYDADTIRIMALAYDVTLKALHDRGQPEIVREIIAKRIVELAAIGQRDPSRLSQTVLSELGLLRR